MRTLSINDIVRLTSLIKDVTSNVEDDFTLISSGDHVTFLPCDFGVVSTLKVYFNHERIELSRADYTNDSGISTNSIVRIVEEIDERVSEEYNR